MTAIASAASPIAFFAILSLESSSLIKYLDINYPPNVLSLFENDIGLSSLIPFKITLPETLQ